MFSLESIGKMLVFFGKLPGDIAIHTKRVHFYFPIVTSLIISLLLTIIINIIFRHK